MLVGFTDARSDLGNRFLDNGEIVVRTPLEQQNHYREVLGPSIGDSATAAMNQVHGAHVAMAQEGAAPTADALVVDREGIAGIVRVADCVPIVLVASDQKLAAVVHAGRVGMKLGVVSAACHQLQARGAQELTAWVGPRACASCYEVPEAMRDEVAAKEPATFATTSWGTPSLDVGAGVVAQLEREGVLVNDIGAGVCTIEDERFWSYRRQGDRAGRFGAVVVFNRSESS